MDELFSEACQTKLFIEKTLDMDCIQQSSTKLLGYLIVFGAPLSKVPQILKILFSK